MTVGTAQYYVSDDETGDTVFRTEQAAREWIVLLDRDGVKHGDVQTFESILDPDDVREIGGG